MDEFEIAIMVIIAVIAIICGFAVLGIAFAFFRMLG
jgi:hypothetical protein